MSLVSMLPALWLTACGQPVGPMADYILTVEGEVPELGPDAIIEFEMHSYSRSVASGTSLEPDCLLEAEGCLLSFGTGGLGRSGADLVVWLDAQGDDDGDYFRALVDHDLIHFGRIDFHSLPWDTPHEIVLVEPDEALGAE